MKVRKIVFLFALVFLSLGLFAQAGTEDESVFSFLSFRDGLSNTSVSGIVQDTRGFLWFGTQGGLNRYDGKLFKLYENEPFEENSLSQNQIQTLFLDKDDILWVGTYSGLNRFDTRKESFTVYRNDPERADSLSGDLVISIARDARGRLWVGTSAGLNRLDEASGSFTRYLKDDTKPGSLPNNTVRALLSDEQGRLWVGTAGGGFARYDEKTDSFIVYPHKPNDPTSLPIDSKGAVMAIRQGPAGSLWVGSWAVGSQAGALSRFDPESGVFKNWALPDQRVYTLNADLQDAVYIGTWGGGLLKLTPDTGRIQTLKHTELQGSLPHDVVYSLHHDRSGVLWVGTNGGGIAKMTSAHQGLRSFIADPKIPNSIAAGKITSVLVDSAGILWAGVYNGGVNRYDPKLKNWKRYTRNPKDPSSLPNDIVNCIYEDKARRFWVGTNDGLALFDRQGGRFKTYLPIKDDPTSLSSSQINTIQEDEKGNLWIGTISDGLEYFDVGKGVFTHNRYDPADPTSLSDNLVYDILYDAQGRLWVATNKGLNRREGAGFKRYLYDPANRRGLSSNSLMCLSLDSSGSVWIGSKGGGLMKYLPESDSFIHATTKNGLPSNIIYGILEGNDKNLWVITLKGLVSYDPVNAVFNQLSVLNNLNDNSFTSGCTVGPDGSIYFGTVGALYELNPRRIGRNQSPPPVYVTDIRAANKRKLAGPEKELTKPLRFRYWENSVEFSFAALDFQDPQANQFAYRLEGFDKEWTYCGSDHEASYTNLPGGRYVFRVKAANNDGVWNESGAAITMSVETPLWLTPWAFVFYLGIVVLIGYLLAVLRGKRKMKAQIEELSRTKAALEEANAKLEGLTSSDLLTGLPNRAKLELELATAWSYSVRAAMPISGLMIDIDFFKKFNDEYGRDTGNECLKRVAGVITGLLERGTDIVARYGGEEFFLLLPSTSAEGARVIGERILKAVRELRIIHKHSIGGGFVTVSIGAATLYPIPGDPSEHLIARTDEALYRAKSSGRDRLAELAPGEEHAENS